MSKKRNRKRGCHSDGGSIVGNENSETAGCGWERENTGKRKRGQGLTKCAFACACVGEGKAKTQLPHPHGYLAQTLHHSAHGPVSLILQVHCKWLRPEAGALRNATIFLKSRARNVRISLSKVRK